MKLKRFSIKLKLLFIFASLITVSLLFLGLLSINIARRAVKEKVYVHLKDKSKDVAEIVDGRIDSLLQFLQGMARNPVLKNTEYSYRQKAELLEGEARSNQDIKYFGICDNAGIRYQANGEKYNIGMQDWYIEAMTGNNFFAVPRISTATNELQIVAGVPIKDDAGAVIGVLSALFDGLYLADAVKDIVVGKTGECYMIDLQDVTIADSNPDAVRCQEKSIEIAHKDASYRSLANFEKKAISEKEGIGFYDYNGNSNIAAFCQMRCGGWILIIRAPISEFMGTVQTLRRSMYAISILILIASLAVVYAISHRLVIPIKRTVDALQAIAKGDGDLTLRLNVAGNDEITDLSLYFNETIAKIASAIKAVDKNADMMEGIGSELSSNMTETASSVHEISSNIESVKQQVMTQAASVTETASTM